MNEIILHGCTPEPLMGYLKALGILRIIAEQIDPDVRGCWRDGEFLLKFNYSREELIIFFLEKYKPTPIVAPWNAGSGFYLKWDDRSKRFKEREAVFAIEQILQSTSERFSPYSKAIKDIKSNLSDIGLPIDIQSALRGKTKEQKKEFLDRILVFDIDGNPFFVGKASKDDFLAFLRSSVLGEESLMWIDTALSLTVGKKKNRHEAPILGSGGNVGNSDFSAMFAQMLLKLISIDGEENELITKRAREHLLASLWNVQVPSLPDFPIGQYDPGKAGSVNQTQGFIAKPFANPWDYVLMCEGALVLSGAISRRTETGPTGASFPFTVRNSNIGYGSAGGENSRGETWLPIWIKPSQLIEIRTIFSEGRADITSQSGTSRDQTEIINRPARNGVEFSRAISLLGIDRGISEFVRYGYQERLGQSYLAVPLGRFTVRHRENSELLREIDPWLTNFQRVATESTTPKRIRSVLSQIEGAIFNFCQHGESSRFAEILCTCGQAEAQLSLTRGKIGKSKTIVSPLAELSPGWVKAAYDGSPEFEIALALAGIYDAAYKIGPLRSNLEPVKAKINKQGNAYYDWADGGREVVWNSADLSRNLATVLERRVMDGGRAACERLPLACRRTASLEAVAAFLAGETDDERIMKLLWGMVLIDHRKDYPHLGRCTIETPPPPLPRSFALIKLLFLPGSLANKEQEIDIKPEMAILPLLRAGRLEDAVQVALRRLRASGLIPLVNTARDWHVPNPARLAAALLIPVASRDIESLKNMAIRPVINTEAVSN